MSTNQSIPPAVHELLLLADEFPKREWLNFENPEHRAFIKAVFGAVRKAAPEIHLLLVRRPPIKPAEFYIGDEDSIPSVKDFPDDGWPVSDDLKELVQRLDMDPGAQQIPTMPAPDARMSPTCEHHVAMAGVCVRCGAPVRTGVTEEQS